jgi:hypothetical protein
VEVVEGATCGPCRGDYRHDRHWLHPRHLRYRLFCWLLFTLATYALPFFAGLTAGLAAFHGGDGVLGALAVGAVAGIATLIVGQIAFTATRSIIIRLAVALHTGGHRRRLASRKSACPRKAGAKHSLSSAR